MIAMDMLGEIKERNRKTLEDRLTQKGGYIIDEDGIRLDGEYFAKQVRIALKNCDVIDPTNIEEYIADRIVDYDSIEVCDDSEWEINGFRDESDYLNYKYG